MIIFFFSKKFPNDEYKRSKFLSAYIKKTMISSKSFPENDLEDISAHCFRATLAVNKYKEGGAFISQNALNNKKVETTLAHYIKINERDIDLKEENKYKNNKTIISSFNLLTKMKILYLTLMAKTF